MANQRLIASMRMLLDRSEELVEKIKGAIADDDPAGAEYARAELEENQATLAEAIARLTPDDERLDEPGPAEPQ